MQYRFVHFLSITSGSIFVYAVLDATVQSKLGLRKVYNFLEVSVMHAFLLEVQCVLAQPKPQYEK